MKRAPNEGFSGKPKRLGIVESQNVLPDCCEEEVPVVLLSTILATMAHARFSAIVDDKIRVTLRKDVAFRPHALCVASFMYNNRSHIFLSNVREYGCEDGEAYVDFELPDHFTVADLRSTFRVPVVEESEFVVTVHQGSKQTVASAIDISLNGIRLRFDDKDDVPKIDESVVLNLKTPEQEVDFRAHVRSQNENQCGMFFPEAMHGLQVEPPESLRVLVRALERDFVRNKKSRAFQNA